MSFNSFNLLEAVELWAAEQNKYFKGNFIDSEEALSARFDEDFAEFLKENEGDQPAIDEAFNNWTDMLCKDGEIHPEQYDSYTYVGKYAED